MQFIAVAVVLAPTAEDELRKVAADTPMWVASTPTMEATLTRACGLGFTVVELRPNGNTPEEWLLNHLDSVDQHHNEYSQPAPYNQLLVFGVKLTSKVAAWLTQFGFVSAANTDFGFLAYKTEQGESAD